MYKKKTMVIALASLFTFSLPLLAEESTGEAAESVATGEATASASTTMEAVPASDAPAAITEEEEARWQARNEHYQDLKQRAEKLGVMLPESPPWSRPAGMQMQRPSMEERQRMHEKMMSMTPEEREATRLAHYEEMRERAKERGIDMPETPPWKQRQEMMEKHQAAIDGMSDEERAACHAMHQRHMGMMQDGGNRPMMRGPGMGPGMMGPGYGYGPAPYGPQNFWNPNQ